MKNASEKTCGETAALPVPSTARRQHPFWDRVTGATVLGAMATKDDRTNTTKYLLISLSFSYPDKT